MKIGYGGDINQSIEVWYLEDSRLWAALRFFVLVPKDLCSWFVYQEEFTDYMIPDIHSKFCEEYLLVYAIRETTDEIVVERFAMCNLATKSSE